MVLIKRFAGHLGLVGSPVSVSVHSKILLFVFVQQFEI